MDKSEWVLTGEQVRGYRLQLGKTQKAMAVMLGFGGNRPEVQLDQIEREKNGRHLTYAQAHLLLAIVQGYQPDVSHTTSG